MVKDNRVGALEKERKGQILFEPMGVAEGLDMDGEAESNPG